MTTDTNISYREGRGVKNFIFAADQSGNEFEIPNWLGRVTNDTDFDTDYVEFEGRGADNRIVGVVILGPSHPSAGEGRFRFTDNSAQETLKTDDFGLVKAAFQAVQPSFYLEFSNYGPMDIDIPDGFIDHSWHNDACPSFYNPDLRLVLHTDYADPSRRDTPDLGRFRLYTYGVNSDGQPDPYETKERLAEVDDIDEVLEVIAERPRPAPAPAAPAAPSI
jgi:hypothetical protein